MSATEVYDQLEASIPDTVSVGPAARGQDKPVVVVTEHTSTTMNVRTMSDLSGRCGELRLAVSPQTALAPEVRSALRGYDCQFSDVVTDYPNPTEIREALRRGDVVLIVGPEGGLDDREVAALTAAGAVPVLLGPSVLRTSTAAAVALGALGVRTERWDVGPLQ